MAQGLSESQQQQLMELQRKFSQLESALRDVVQDKQYTEHDLAKTQSTLENLKPFEENVTTYRVLGKAFMKAPLTFIRSELSQAGEECTSEIKALSEKEATIEKQLQQQKQVLIKWIDQNKLGHIVKFQDRS